MAKDRRDGSKLSFAERDKLRRERGKGGGGKRGRGGGSGKASYAQKSYKAALERAFADGRVEEFAATLTKSAAPPSIELPKAAPAPSAKSANQDSEQPAPAAAKPKPRAKKPTVNAERRKLLAKIKEAEGAREVGPAVDRFVAKFGELPNDYEVLEKALAHPNSAVVTRTLEQLNERLATNKPRRSRSLAMQLEILEDTGDDAEIRELAEKARKQL